MSLKRHEAKVLAGRSSTPCINCPRLLDCRASIGRPTKPIEWRCSLYDKVREVRLRRLYASYCKPALTHERY